MEETAIQQFNWWLNWELESLLDGTLGYNEFKKKLEAQFLEAIAIEKKQMKECTLKILDSEKEVVRNFIRDQFEQYYNETFNNTQL